MSFQGFITPGIVEELYISGDEVIFRNYSVNNTLSLGLITPVSVKWGVRDNHFFVQTGTGAGAIFRIYTLDRAAEGAIYQPGIIPTATLVKTLSIAPLNVLVSTLLVKQTISDTFTLIAHWVVDPPPEAVTNQTLEFFGTPTQETISFIVDAGMFGGNSPSFGAANGFVYTTPDYETAVLDGELNLLIPFQIEWRNGASASAYWRYVTSPVASFSQELTGPGACHVVTTNATTTYSFRLREAHAGVINLEKNTLVYSTLPLATVLENSTSGTGYGGWKKTAYFDPPPPPISFACFGPPFSQGTIPIDFGGPYIRLDTQEMSLYAPSFPARPSGGSTGVITTGGVVSDGIVTVTTFNKTTNKRWNVYSTITPLVGRRSPGPLSGGILAAVLKVQHIPTGNIAEWSGDVAQTGWFLLRGAGLGTSTTLRAMQANAPSVTIMSANEKYLLWNIPGHVYRTTLTTGNTVEVGTDPTKFTSRDLRLIHPVYLYSLAETNNDEGIDGHFFVDIESTPLPTTDLPVTGSLVKWDMLNPVDDLKHL